MNKINENFSLPWHMRSMTGLGRAQMVGDVTVEITIKSVNQRALDIKYRLLEEFSYLETSLNRVIAEFLERGRIDVSIHIKGQKASVRPLMIDQEKAESLILEAANLSDKFPEVLPIAMGDIFSVPGLLLERPKDYDQPALDLLVTTTLKSALLDLVESREQEGGMLAVVLKDLLQKSSWLLDDIEEMQNQDVEKRFERFKSRMEELFKSYSVKEDRLYQEFALLAERFDIKEEVDRLKAHVVHFDRLCQTSLAKGRKLDFLCQEMLRESNTLMSKSFSSAITVKAIDLKAEIERLREQVQNIE